MLPGIKQFVINWNRQFPLDKWWRDKHKIAINSEAHLQANQVDILLEFIEGKIYEEYYVAAQLSISKDVALKAGNWLTDRSPSEEMSDEDFDKIVI